MIQKKKFLIDKLHIIISGIDDNRYSFPQNKKRKVLKNSIIMKYNNHTKKKHQHFFVFVLIQIKLTLTEIRIRHYYFLYKERRKRFLIYNTSFFLTYKKKTTTIDV
jgi:hypothetical protein